MKNNKKIPKSRLKSAKKSEGRKPYDVEIRDYLKSRCLLYCIIYTIIDVMITLFIMSHSYMGLNKSFIFDIYQLLYTRYKWLTFITTLVIGYAFIVNRMFKVAVDYMKQIVEGITQVYNDDDNDIVLSKDLQEVEDRIRYISRNLKTKERVALESEKRKNDLVMYLAHDLKTPLTSIIGYLGILREDDISDSFREKYTDICYDKALRLEDLINEFFDITRFGVSNIVLEKQRVNISVMCEQIMWEFMPQTRAKGLNIESDIEPDIVGLIDSKKFERVLDNLLRNAITYSYENTNIYFNLSSLDRENIKVEVLNSGPTIPPEKIKRIFEEFFRVDSSRSTKEGNAGLGLAIAKSIVEAHGGTIRAKSNNNVTMFEVVIPIF